MKKLLFMFCSILITFQGYAEDKNLVIFIDNLHQETIKTDEINITHQLITALQQKVPLVLASCSLYKNIQDRKNLFEKNIQKKKSIERSMDDFFEFTHQKVVEYYPNVSPVNQLCTQSWYEKYYSDLARMEQKDIDQLKFNFLCHHFALDHDYHVYILPFGMVLFALSTIILPSVLDQYKVDDNATIKISDKKSDLIKSLECMIDDKDESWVIYLAGHGHPESSLQGGNIAGLLLEEFRNFLLFCDKCLRVDLLVYASCYGGGVHTVEPYKDISLSYPVVVIALTDAPIFGFGLFEGFKLPPYDATFYLEPQDVSDRGLLPYAMQNYIDFFNRARQKKVDMKLIQSLSHFFICDKQACHMQKVENIPLIRSVGQNYFTLFSDPCMQDFVTAVRHDDPMVIYKPILLYSKKIQSVKFQALVPIVSMLPGLVSHEISLCDASLYRLSEIIPALFLAFPDSEHCAHYKIKKLMCHNDMIGAQGAVTLTNVLILQQKKLRPACIDEKVQLAVYWKYKGVGYLILYDQGKVIEQRIVSDEEFKMMQSMYQFVEKSIDYGLLQTPETLLTYDRYMHNQEFHTTLVDECIQAQVCKK